MQTQKEKAAGKLQKERLTNDRTQQRSEITPDDSQWSGETIGGYFFALFPLALPLGELSP
jgi:hypothetical protein